MPNEVRTAAMGELMRLAKVDEEKLMRHYEDTTLPSEVRGDIRTAAASLSCITAMLRQELAYSGTLEELQAELAELITRRR